MLTNTGTAPAAALTTLSASVSVGDPAVAPETQIASGAVANTVVRVMAARSRSARYCADSGTMLNSSFTSAPPTRARCRATSPTLVSHSPKSLA